MIEATHTLTAMTERHWWDILCFWRRFTRPPQAFRVRAFRSDGTEIELTKSIEQRRREADRAR